MLTILPSGFLVRAYEHPITSTLTSKPYSLLEPHISPIEVDSPSPRLVPLFAIVFVFSGRH